MIIKRKLNNNIEKNTPSNSNTDLENPAQESDKEHEKLRKFDFKKIDFEQRAERRQGTRRRGYRRIDDRNLISRAQEEAISIKENAIKEGNKIGLQTAKEDVEKLLSAIEEFFAYKDVIVEELSSHILDISLEIAQKIIKTELEKDVQPLLNIINEALNSVSKGESRIVIKVNPDDSADVKRYVPDILSNAQIEAKIVVLADESIELGGAIIETNNGIVDATIETQLGIIKEAFKTII